MQKAAASEVVNQRRWRGALAEIRETPRVHKVKRARQEVVTRRQSAWSMVRLRKTTMSPQCNSKTGMWNVREHTCGAVFGVGEGLRSEVQWCGVVRVL